MAKSLQRTHYFITVVISTEIGLYQYCHGAASSSPGFGVRNEDLVQLSQQGWPGKAVRGCSGNTRLWGKRGDTSEEANSLQKGQIRANREGTAKYGDILRVGSEKGDS